MWGSFFCTQTWWSFYLDTIDRIRAEEVRLTSLKECLTPSAQLSWKFLVVHFHSTGMRTLKFHLLSHLAEDVEKFGALHSINAGVSEHAHLRCKDAYRRTSKRRNTANEETIRLLKTSEMIRKASERVLGSSAVISKGATKNGRRCFICTRWRKVYMS